MRWFAHMDLYRAEEEFSMDEIGVRDTREYHGFFIEWPEVPSEEETIRPTHKLEIKYSEDGDQEVINFLKYKLSSQEAFLSKKAFSFQRNNLNHVYPFH